MRIFAVISVVAFLFAMPGFCETVTNEKLPLSMTTFVTCANGGAGELVSLSGYLHFRSSITVDNSGGLHVQQHSQPMGVAGEGQTTHAKYQGTGVTRSGFNVDTVDGWPYTYTYVNNFRIIGQGAASNFTVHQTVHVTINANGTVTTKVDNFKTECK